MWGCSKKVIHDPPPPSAKYWSFNDVVEAKPAAVSRVALEIGRVLLEVQIDSIRVV